MGIDNINVSVKVPEYIIYYGLQAGLKFLSTNYISASDKTKSILYMYLKNAGIERYELFKQGIQVFAPEADDPRKLTVDLMYNRSKNGAPNVYITMPAEQTSQNALGFGDNYGNTVFQDFDANNQNGTYRPQFARRFQTTYSLVITSDNENEVVLIYHVIRAMIISLNSHFSLAGLQNLSLGGADLSNYNKELPNNLRARAINMNFQYETKAVDFNEYPMIADMLFNGKIINESFFDFNIDFSDDFMRVPTM